MISRDQKEEVLKALYLAASDPGSHEDFIDQWLHTLDSNDDPISETWIERHIEAALSIFEKLQFSGTFATTATELAEVTSGPAAIVDPVGSIVASNRAWNQVVPETTRKIQNLTDSGVERSTICLLYTSPSPRDLSTSRMPSSA